MELKLLEDFIQDYQDDKDISHHIKQFPNNIIKKISFNYINMIIENLIVDYNANKNISHYIEWLEKYVNSEKNPTNAIPCLDYIPSPDFIEELKARKGLNNGTKD